MMDSGKYLTTAIILILMMNIRGQTFHCHQTEYQVGNECCPLCPPGQRVKMDCTDFRSTVCQVCTEGTYMNQPTGRTRCYDCKLCDAGSGLKVKNSCTTSSNTVCEPLEGFYCEDFKEGDCAAAKKHTSCRPGQYISQNGWFSCADCSMYRDTVCSDCSEGTYSDGTFTSCQPHTQCGSLGLKLIKAGTVSADAECGGTSTDWKVILGIIILIVLLLTAAGVFIFLLKKKKLLNTDSCAVSVSVLETSAVEMSAFSPTSLN